MRDNSALTRCASKSYSWMLVTAPVTSSMVGGDQNTTLYSSSSSISPGPGAPGTTSSQSPSSPSGRNARDSQYAAAATAEGGGGELARRGRPPAAVRERGDAMEVEAPEMKGQRAFAKGPFAKPLKSFSSSERHKRSKRLVSAALLLSSFFPLLLWFCRQGCSKWGLIGF